MTDEQIIKALEWCGCEECMAILELINRQKAELSRAKDYIELLEIEKQALKEDSDKSKATAMGVIKRQDAEIESRNDLIHRQSDVISEQKEKIESIYSESIKEFAERLKEMSEYFWEEKENFVSEYDIDNLVKEMVGEG